MDYPQLKHIVGEKYVSDSPLEIYANTLAYSPDQEVYIVRPADTEQVAEIVKLANREGIHVIPRGFSTRSSSSPFSKVASGIIIDMTRMQTIRRIDPGTMIVTVEAGCSISKLCSFLAPKGYRVIEGTLCPYCASVGDTMGYGPGENKYGPRQEQILDLEVVLPSGEVLQTGTVGMGSDHLAKYLGPDLTGLFLEAGGSLGVVTAVSYKLHRLPEYIDYANYEFMDVNHLVSFMEKLIQEGLTHLPSLYEIYFWPKETFMIWEKIPHIRDQNKNFTRIFNKWNNNFPSDVIGIVYEGTRVQVEYEKQRTAEIAIECGSTGNIGVEPIKDHYIDRNWDGNTKAHEDAETSATGWAEPIFRCRIDQYPEAKKLTKEAAESNGFRPGYNYWRGARLGPRYISNYPCVSYDPSDPDAVRRARNYYQIVLDGALEMGAYRSVETQFESEGENTAFKLIRELKKLLDPNGVMMASF
jgi:FAD/FMN-containing dehydrogenase